MKIFRLKSDQTYFLGLLLVAILPFAAVACGAAPQASVPEVQEVVVTRVVEKEVEVIVTEVVAKEVVVTATPEPVPEMSADEPVNLRVTLWSSNEAHLALFNGIAEAYRAEHPNVTVEFDPIPFGDYVSKLTVQLAGGSPPDLGWIVDNTAPTFIEAGVIVDLRPVLEQFPGYDLDDYSQSALGLWTRDDVIYGVPFSTSPFVILYNRDLLEAAGVSTPEELIAEGEWTWENLAEIARAVVETAPAGTYGFESYDGLGYDFRAWNTIVPIIRAYGTDAWNIEGTQCLMADPEAVAAMELYHKMIFGDSSAVPPGEVGDFFSGQSAMTITQLSRTAKLQDADFEWDVAPLPGGPAGNPQVIGQAAFVVFKSSPNQEVAADFLAFMTNEENVAKMSEFFPPARISVLESDEFLTSNPLVSPESMELALVESIRVGDGLPAHPEFPKIDLAGRAALDNLWVPDADVEAVLNEVCTAITPFLSQ